MTIEFFVPGTPRPGGSKKAFVIKGRAILTDASGKAGKQWRDSVKAYAMEAMKGRPPMTGALNLDITFVMPRPKSHYDAIGFIKDKHLNERIIKRPDCTKLIRSAEDAMTGIVWLDDAQVDHQSCGKVYVSESNKYPGAIIQVWS